MEAMIKRIIDIDEKAREITDAAQRERKDSEEEIVEKARRLRDDYLEKARRASAPIWKPNRSWLMKSGNRGRPIMPIRPPAGKAGGGQPQPMDRGDRRPGDRLTASLSVLSDFEERRAERRWRDTMYPM